MAEFLEAAESAARAGGAVLLEWRGRFEVREKGPSDLVTEADFAAQEAVRSLLLGTFPDHVFIGEESPSPVDPTHEYCWIVDPLDGTTNYVHGTPHYACSVALAHRGRPVAGAIFDPNAGECFTAALGGGAWLNGRRISTSQVNNLGQALVAASFSAHVTRDSPEIDQFNAVLVAAQSMRRTGSAALNLAYLAAGRFDAFWALSTKAWDVAAGVLLVEEAGGVVTDLDGGAFDLRRPHPVAASRPGLHREFREILAAAGRDGRAR